MTWPPWVTSTPIPSLVTVASIPASVIHCAANSARSAIEYQVGATVGSVVKVVTLVSHPAASMTSNAPITAQRPTLATARPKRTAEDEVASGLVIELPLHRDHVPVVIGRLPDGTQWEMVNRRTDPHSFMHVVAFGLDLGMDVQ